MEHRWHTRWPVNFDVLLYHHGLPIAHCRASNLSLNGILVQGEPSNLPIDGPVEIEFEYQAHEPPRRCRLSASIIHQSDQGTGLMFLQEGSNSFLALEEMLTRLQHTESLALLS